jgi:hypothetical protein
MDRKQAMEFAFALHHTGHLQNLLVRYYLPDITRLSPSVRARLEALKAAGDSARGGGLARH